MCRVDEEVGEEEEEVGAAEAGQQVVEHVGHRPEATGKTVTDFFSFLTNRVWDFK